MTRRVTDVAVAHVGSVETYPGSQPELVVKVALLRAPVLAAPAGLEGVAHFRHGAITDTVPSPLLVT